MHFAPAVFLCFKIIVEIPVVCSKLIYPKGIRFAESHYCQLKTKMTPFLILNIEKFYTHIVTQTGCGWMQVQGGDYLQCSSTNNGETRKH